MGCKQIKRREDTTKIMKRWTRVYKPLIIERYPMGISQIKKKRLRNILRMAFLPASVFLNIKYLNKSRNSIPHMNLVVTTKCTLRCKDCLHLIPYHKCPEDVPYEEIEKNIKKLVKFVDIIGTVTVLGGEPFVYKDIVSVLKLLIEQNEVKRIIVTTNGTIVPSEKVLEILNNPKVFVVVSNYGTVSRNVEQLKKTFKEYNVKYFAEPYHDWLDAGGRERRGYSAEKMQKMFEHCNNAFNCASFYKNIFVSCPRELNLKLQGIQDSAKETIDIDKINSKEEMNKALSTFYNMKFTPACNYCNIGSEEERTIPCGEQL